MRPRNIQQSGEQILLRELTVDDASQAYCDWLNDPVVNKYLETRHATTPQLREYIQKQIDDPNSLFLGVLDKQSGQHIGNVKLEPIDWQNKKAVFGILIGEKSYWNRGVGTEATRLAVTIAFGMECVELGVISENAAAIRAYQKVGFRETQRIPKAMNHGGILYDKVVMQIQA